MKLDQGNCHLLYLNINMKIFWIVTKKWKSNKLLGLDRNLNFMTMYGHCAKNLAKTTQYLQNYQFYWHDVFH